MAPDLVLEFLLTINCMMNNAARGGLAIALSLSVLTAANVMGSEPAVITISATNAGPTINLGGWGNTQHGVEMNQTPVGAPVPGQIDRQRWYDVKVEISGSRIRCYLDGQLIHDATVPITQKFYAVTGRDAKSGDLVVKAINLGNEAVPAQLNLQGVGQAAATAQATVLQSANLNDNNSLEQPKRVVPVENVVSGVGESFSHEFPARSLTVLRVKTK